jgi:hypothetical protein
VKRYVVLVRQQDNRVLQKVIDSDECNELFEDSFIELVDCRDDDQKNFCFDDIANESRFLIGKHIKQQLRHMKPLYIQKIDENCDKILFVKAIISVRRDEDSVNLIDNISWYVLCEKDAENEYKYRPITYTEITDIMSTQMVMNQSIDFLSIFNNEFDTGIIDPGHLLDENDPSLGDMNIKIWGALDTMYPYYADVGNKLFCAGNNTNKVRGIRFNQSSKMFDGLVHVPNENCRTEELPYDWVVDNFSEEMINYVKSREKPTFVTVPPGDVRQIPEQFVKKSHPVVKYQQNDENTCAYCSTCSILDYLHFNNEAVSLATHMKDRKLSTFSSGVPDKPLESISNFIHNNISFSSFRQIYRWKKINSSFDILNHPFGVNDFILVTIWDNEGDTSHAVCATGQWIFDSNATNALIFDRRSLDACCRASFSKIHRGYLFVRLSENTSKKRQRDK